MYTGLSSSSLPKLREKYGYNRIEAKEGIHPIRIFFSQFTSPLILLLVGASLSLFALSQWTHEDSTLDVVLILIIVLLSGISGFIQEYKAERSIEALKNMASPKATVVRNKKEQEISAEELLPGDIILLEEGSIVPADATLLESHRLSADESFLTGESEAVTKNEKEALYMNSLVLAGRGVAKVTSIGLSTKVGEIATELDSMEEQETLFKKEVRELSTKLLYTVLGIAAFIFVVGSFRYEPVEAFITAIALAVAAIPEGLPAVLVVALALGARHMAKDNALGRKLGVIETMGAVTVICTDKTGTITKNDMEVLRLSTPGSSVSADKARPSNPLLACLGLNHSLRERDGKLIGDQTEQALFRFARTFDTDLKTEHDTVDELPFDSSRKMMSVLVEQEAKRTMYTKGAPEKVLKRCTHFLNSGKKTKLTTDMRASITREQTKYSAQALRMIGCAYRPLTAKGAFEEKELVWLGMLGIKDPARPEVMQAMEESYSAGIDVLMMTGDHALTAKAIAEEVGLKTTGVATGKELEKLTDAELEKLLQEGVRVFARMSPQQKLRVTTLLQTREEIVAMTGDGVNDALALKKAHVGVAMGIRGTDVSKQASDLILLDDNFASIVGAIRQGRRIFRNIQKFVSYLLTSNLAEVLVLLISTIFIASEHPLLLPAQLLWINLLTDGFPAIALGADPASPTLMTKPPRKHQSGVFTKEVRNFVLSIGIQKTLLLISVYLFTLPFGEQAARTALFGSFVFYEFLVIYLVRSGELLHSFANPSLFWSLFISGILHVGLIYSPFASYFGLIPLGLEAWLIVAAILLIGYAVGILSMQLLRTTPVESGR